MLPFLSKDFINIYIHLDIYTSLFHVCCYFSPKIAILTHHYFLSIISSHMSLFSCIIIFHTLSIHRKLQYFLCVTFQYFILFYASLVLICHYFSYIIIFFYVGISYVLLFHACCYFISFVISYALFFTCIISRASLFFTLIFFVIHNFLSIFISHQRLFICYNFSAKIL